MKKGKMGESKQQRRQEMGDRHSMAWKVLVRPNRRSSFKYRCFCHYNVHKKCLETYFFDSPNIDKFLNQYLQLTLLICSRKFRAFSKFDFILLFQPLFYHSRMSKNYLDPSQSIQVSPDQIFPKLRALKSMDRLILYNSQRISGIFDCEWFDWAFFFLSSWLLFNEG